EYGGEVEVPRHNLVPVTRRQGKMQHWRGRGRHGRLRLPILLRGPDFRLPFRNGGLLLPITLPAAGDGVVNHVVGDADSLEHHGLGHKVDRKPDYDNEQEPAITIQHSAHGWSDPVQFGAVRFVPAICWTAAYGC